MKLKALLGGVVTAVFLAGTASAVTTHTLTATSNVARFGDFTIDFEDKDGDGQFSIDELVSFSGMLYSNFRLFDNLLSVAGSSGVTDGSTGIRWELENQGTVIRPAEDAWSYSIASVGPTPVPLPATMPLLLAAIAWLGFSMRGQRLS